MSIITVTFDGLCQPNPGGVATWGVAAWYDDAMQRKAHGFIGEGAGSTNNVAEWRAALAAMQTALSLCRNHEDIRIGGDSQLVINQLRGEWQVHAAPLRRYWERAQELLYHLRTGGAVEFTHIRRDKNELADSLCRAELRAVLALKRKYEKMSAAELTAVLTEMTLEWAGYLDEGFGELGVPRDFRRAYDIALAEYDRR